MSLILMYVLLLYVKFWPSEVLGQQYILNATILGYKGKTEVDKYYTAAEVLSNSHNKHCKVQFTPLEYDTFNGTTVYTSLENARSTFDNKNTTVAIGPFVDVFTSMDYVIRQQVHFVTDKTETMEDSDRSYPVLPDPKSLSQSVAGIVKKLNWTKVAFLSQDDFSPVLELSRNGVFVWPIRLPNNITNSTDEDLINNLKTLRKAQMETSILHSMRKDVVQNVILAAEDLHLLHHSLSWFVTYLDFDDIWDGPEHMPTAGATIFGLQLLNKTFIPQLLLDKYKSMSRLEISLLVDIVEMLYHYLDVWNGCDRVSEDKYMSAEVLPSILKSKSKLYNGALGTYAWEKVNGKGLARTQYSMKILNRKLENITEVGNCTVGLSTNINLVNIPKKRIPKLGGLLHGNVFDVIAKEEAPFVMRKRNNAYEGFCIDVLDNLKDVLGFNYRLTLMDTNTKWDSIIAKLTAESSERYDVAIGSLVVKAEREEKISFSHTILYSTVSILLSRPPFQRTFFQFLWPFNYKLWIMIVVFFFIVGFSLYVMARYDTTQEKVEQKFDLKESMWYSLNVLLQGGTDYSPQTTSMRTIVAFYWFCTLIITAAYTANLAAYLTLQQIDDRVKTVDSLSKQATVQYGIRKGTELADFFKHSRIDPYERMWAFMTLKDTLLENIFDGIKRAKTGLFAYLDDGKINEYYAMQHCVLESIDQNFGDKQYSIGFPKGAPYRDDINRAILTLKERGVLDTLERKWWSPAPNCTEKELGRKVKTTAELELDNMFGVFFILGASVVGAIFFEIVRKLYLAVNKKEEKEAKTPEPT